MDTTTTGLASQAAPDASNRRAHPRIASAELPEPALIRIPNRPAITLVDLSSGGALLELPFQLPPESRVTLELSTSTEQLAVPFQLLRCYVTELVNGGLRYHAAGAFDQALKLPPSLAAALRPGKSDRLIDTLEGILRASQANNLTSRGAGFNELLSWVVSLLRKGEPAAMISIQIKSHLAQLFPSLLITPASSLLLQDVSRSARFFNLEFRSEWILNGSDRRFLRATAQLITLVDRDAGRQAIEDADAAALAGETPSSLVVHSVAEWQSLATNANSPSFGPRSSRETFFSRRSSVA